MPQYIIHKNGVFNVFSTVVDAPLIERGLSRAELEEWYRREHGEEGMAQLPARLERAEATGTSAMAGTTLQDLVAFNRAGPSETSLPQAEFERLYLSAGVEDSATISRAAEPKENPRQDHSGTAS